MMNIGMTRMSSKGQIVIPAEMRKKFKKGVQFIVIQRGNQLILKPAEMDKQLAEDLEVARRTEAALKRYDQGKFKSLSKEEFLRELEKW